MGSKLADISLEDSAGLLHRVPATKQQPMIHQMKQLINVSALTPPRNQGCSVLFVVR